MRVSKKNLLPYELLLSDFQKKINKKFNNKGLLNKAFCHKSFANEHPNYTDNQRLEFLGDSVLDLTITAYLFTRFPQKDEGDLTHIKNYLVSEQSLAAVAHTLDLGRYLLMGTGERKTGGSQKAAVLADAMEALFAALYLDQGLAVAEEFIIALLKPQIDLVLSNKHNQNFKSLLQELSQQKFQALPVYTMLSEKGPEHAKIFTVEVTVEPHLVARGEGSNKKNAEQAAAKCAFLLITEDNPC